MPDPNKDVNAEESSAAEEQDQQTSQDQVEDTTSESSEQETTETQQSQEQGQAQATDAVDEMGVPYKNRAMEWQRKYQEVADEERLEKVALKVLEQQKQHKTQEQEYTISQLEQFAIDNPAQRPWVEERKSELLQKQVARITEEKVKEVETKQRDAFTRQRAEEWVSSHPRLQEALMVDPMGRKVFNTNHPLTQMISQYMRDPDMQKRPDALVISSKLALADYMDTQATKSQKKVKVLEQNLKKVQKATLVEGNTSQQDVIRSKTKYNKAMENLHATGSKEALREVLKAKLGIED